ncbi:hypothetical protein BGZ98_007263, partial [Dissophora globulifera]
IMREPNFSFPNLNRAAICITSSIYDRRALDCTDYIPLINTLTNLAYLTGSTPTIREFITRDGGLERLVTILKNTKVNDRRNGLKWTLAFQCVVNIGVRGTEHIRKRVVQAGMVPVIVNVLESFFSVLKSVSEENERNRQRREAAQLVSQPMIADGDASMDSQPITAPLTDEIDPMRQGSGMNISNNSSLSLSSSITVPSLTTSLSTSITTGPSAPSTANMEAQPNSQTPIHYGQSATTMHEAPRNLASPSHAQPTAMDASESRPQQFFYREDDILHSLQLLAYLSKYPSLRSSFHTDSGSNVFAIVEKFTHRTMHPLEIQYWAGVIMRNACRKDDARKGIRQCAYTGCGKWETKPREFAKCRRCRKAKYCSKDCQSKAWNEGHRWWCIEKKPDSMAMSTSFENLPPAPPPPPPPADLQDQPETGPSMMENGGIASMGAGGGGARMIGGGEGGRSTGHHVHDMQPHHQHHHQHGLQPQQPQQLQQAPQQSYRISSSSVAGSHAQPQAAFIYTSGAPSSSTSGQHRHHYHSQQHLQRQPLSLPQQTQPSSSPLRVSQQPQQQQQPAQPHRHQASAEHRIQDQPNLQHLQQHRQQQQQQGFSPIPQQHQTHPPQQQQQQHPRQQQLPQQQQQQQPRMQATRQCHTSSSSMNRGLPTPQRSMTDPHPSSAPIRLSQRSDLTLHLGVSPDSPTPEQLAQRFVQQVALNRGQQTELAQNLHSQFQQYFPPHHLAEAKRHSPRAPKSFTDVSKQGTPRRRSDLDSDEEEARSQQSGPHSTSSLSIPMLTQDLSTTMSLTSTGYSSRLPPSIVDGRVAQASFGPSAEGVMGMESDVTNAEQATARDYKVRKLMSPEQSSAQAGSSTANLRRPDSSRREDEWSYSRHMAKDGSVDP